MRAQWVTVGRAEEHSIAEAHIAEGGVVLAGPPGVGKSRLAADLLDAADGRGAHTKRLAATASGAAVPLGALVPALPQLDPTGQGGFALLRAVVAELSSAPSGASGPVVLGIDDAHQLDDLSATAIHQLVTTHAAAVVVTVRSGEEVPDAVRALWKDGLLARIELQPLARHEVDELVAGMLGDLVAAPTLDLVWRHSEGNPLFARELVVSGIESGRLDRADGTLAVGGAVHGEHPPGGPHRGAHRRPRRR